MSIDMETVKLIIQVTTFNITKKLELMETTFQTRVDTLEQENRSLYKRVEKLSEANTQNEMEKEDKNSFINRVSSRVTILYQDVKTHQANIDIAFENFEQNDKDREEEFEYNETNDKEIKKNINLLFEHDKNNERNIKKLFRRCELYKTQIEILFDTVK